MKLSRALLLLLPIALSSFALPTPAAAVLWLWDTGLFVEDVTAPNPVPATDQVLLSGIGRKRILGPLEVVNGGTWYWSGDGDIRLEDGGRIVNVGTIVRTGAAGSASVTTLGVLGGSFENQGLVYNDGAGLSLALGGGTLINTGTLHNYSEGLFTLPPGWLNQGVLTGRGSFSIGGAGLFNGGTIAPGSGGIGTLKTITSNAFTMNPQGKVSVDVASATAFDVFDVSGSGFGDATLAGTLQINCFGPCALSVGDELVVMTARDELVGSFDTIVLNGFATGAFDVFYDRIPAATDRVRLRVTAATSPVPEPAMGAAMMVGAVALALLGRRRSAV